MVKFKANDKVLIASGYGGYRVTKFMEYVSEDKCLIYCGNYCTEYNVKDVHKCPSTIKE